MYGKHFASMYTGSMYGAGVHVFAVWGFCIGNSDKHGEVELNPIPLAHQLGNCEPEDIEAAIAFLMSPDPKSRSKKEDGRRLTEIGPYFYRLVNHGDYKKIQKSEDRREYLMLKKRQERTGKPWEQIQAEYEAEKQSTDMSTESPMSTHVSTHTDTDAVTDTDTPPTTLPQKQGELLTVESVDPVFELARRFKAVQQAVSKTAEKEAAVQLGADIVFRYWMAKLGHLDALPDKNRLAKIATRLRECKCNVSQLLYAIDGVYRSDFHMGRDPKTDGKAHDGIEVIFRNRAQVEKFLALVPKRDEVHKLLR